MVNAAAAGLGVKEYAVAIVVFLETFSDPNFPHVLTFESGDIHFYRGGEVGNLLFVHPNESRRAGTAITALRTFET